jgi:hypothetical protein
LTFWGGSLLKRLPFFVLKKCARCKMSLDVLEKIKNESIPLYGEIVRVARKKWDVIDYEKKTSELYIITVRNNKKPKETLRVKCIFLTYKWVLIGEK